MEQLKEATESPQASFDIVCHDVFGIIKWKETIRNLVMTAGKTDILNVYFGATAKESWFMILKGAGTIAASDTLASHAGWTEVTAYTGNRPAITFGSASAGSITSTAVVFTMNGAYTVAGAGCCTVATGTSGVLYDAADFGSSRTGASGDTLTITPTLSMS